MKRAAKSSPLALILLLLSIAGAAADECPPLRLANSVQMEPSANGNAMYVPVTLNGVPKKLLFDTGGAITQIASHTYQELNLERVMNPGLLIRDYAGNMSMWTVTIREFILGHTLGRRLVFPVAPDSNLGVGPDPFDGLLSSDLLLGYDLDVDFGSKTLNFFSQDHCPGKVLYWSSPVVGMVPVTIENKSAIIVPVVIDGQTVSALIDTGAGISSMRARVASRIFNLTRGEKDSDLVLGNSAMGGFVHTFSSLAFGDIAVKNPRIGITSFRDEKREAAANSRFDQFSKEPDLIIGMNILKPLHIYLETKQKRLYVSPATAAGKAPAPASGRAN
jgi:predicted aspartyl protease